MKITSVYQKFILATVRVGLSLMLIRTRYKEYVVEEHVGKSRLGPSWMVRRPAVDA